MATAGSLMAPLDPSDACLTRKTGPEFAVRSRHLGNLGVLFPERLILNEIGGRGLEFCVGDRNYDEGGRVSDVRRRRERGPEPGVWPVELMPEQAALEDEFLVVLLPSTIFDRPVLRITRIKDGAATGWEIAGAVRTTRWLYDPGRGLVEARVVSARAPK